MAVDVHIETAPRYNNDQPVEIVFTIINNTAQDIYVLKRETPLEGLKSDCLIVMVDGRRVKYDGKLVKRREPRKEDYVFIKAGGSVSKTVDVSQAYKVSEQGEYEVTFDERRLVILPPEQSESLEGLSNIPRERTMLEVSPQAARFFMEAGIQPRQTLGELMRETQKNPEVSNEVVEAAPRLQDPIAFGGTGGQTQSVSAAHENAYKYVIAGIEKLGNNEHYNEWFGRHTALREKKVRDSLIAVKNAMETKPFAYDLSGGACDGDEYAFTFFGVNTVWICSFFWDASPRGMTSKAGTIVHEHTHSSASVDDIPGKYGEVACRKLAEDSPDEAIDNADNYEFFVESLE